MRMLPDGLPLKVAEAAATEVSASLATSFSVIRIFLLLLMKRFINTIHHFLKIEKGGKRFSMKNRFWVLSCPLRTPSDA
jgi:hypothetical protein